MSTVQRFIFIAAFVGACSSSGGGDTGDAGVTPDGARAMPGNYFPMAVGNVWKYQVTQVGEAPTYKWVTIEAMENVGGMGPNAGKPAYRHNTCKSSMTPDGCGQPSTVLNKLDKTLGWWGVVTGNDGKTTVNFREESFKAGKLDTPIDETYWDPYRLRIDEIAPRLIEGARYSERFREIKQAAAGGPTSMTQQTVNWTVDGVELTVTVMPPSGAAKNYDGCLKVSHSLASDGAKSFWFCRGVGKVKEVGSQTEELYDYTLAP